MEANVKDLHIAVIEFNVAESTPYVYTGKSLEDCKAFVGNFTMPSCIKKVSYFKNIFETMVLFVSVYEPASFEKEETK